MTQGRAQDPDNRVVDIRSSPKYQASHGQRTSHVPAPAGKLEAFESAEDDPDDFRHRMVTNALAFGFVALLVVGAIWLADSILTMRKNQDCGLQGRKNCVQIDTKSPSR